MIDLHSHSTFSDGKLQPDELLNYAKQRGITTLALTDHDAIGGLSVARIAAQKLGITLINGVEITVNWKKNLLHIIGLNINPENASLLTALAEQARLREERALLIGQKLSEAGIANAYDNAKQLAGSGNITRAHFAESLVNQGHAKDMQSAFKRYLGRGKIGFVAASWMDLSAAVTLIQQSGGLSVIAHPMRYGLTASKLRELIAIFKQFGGNGLEVISGHQAISEINLLASLCQAHDLLASVGSDFHGEGLSNVAMGCLAPLPAGCTPIWSRF